jgi:hypothetical protein
MNLMRRNTHAPPDWCQVGATIHAVAPTMQKALTGVVLALDGVTVTLYTPAGMLVAVDVEDCRLEPEGVRTVATAR